MQTMNQVAFFWNQQPLAFPGLDLPSKKFLCSDDEPELNQKPLHEIFLDDRQLKRLGICVFTQAVKDACGNYTPEREQARIWLLEEGATWAEYVGLNIRQGMLEDLAQKGWVNTGKRKSPRKPKQAEQE
jgi:hypothetical protein